MYLPTPIKAQLLPLCVNTADQAPPCVCQADVTPNGLTDECHAASDTCQPDMHQSPAGAHPP
jgi:hypothetical protein